MRTAAEWGGEIRARRARLSAAREPWLIELLELLVAAAIDAQRKARAAGR